MNNHLIVIKASGLEENYNEQKIKTSLSRSGIGIKNQQRIIETLTPKLYNRISTQEIENIVSDLIAEFCPTRLNRYRLKEAMMALGPTGFPFEQFVSQLLQAHGYQTETDKVMSGKCVSHEIDVLAKRGNQVSFVECKYHNQHGSRSDVKTTLYVKARTDDLKNKILLDHSSLVSDQVYSAWIFTNTKFSVDAIAYALCENIRLTGWNYPEKQNLQEMIEQKKIYPITVLTSLTFEQKRKLIEQKVISLVDLKISKNLLNSFSLDQNNQEKIFTEIEHLENNGTEG
jgi:hypothetical protein